MNICEAIKTAKEENCAIKRTSWNEDVYAYHGMDNILCIHNTYHNTPIVTNIALFLQEDWEIVKSLPYHGNLNIG